MFVKARRIVVFFLEVLFPYFIPAFFIALLITDSLSNKVSIISIDLLESIKIVIYQDFYPKIREKDGILITVSAVFIGIYFTIFSILGNIREDSTINVLKENHFKRLLNYIFFAFLSSFAYLFLSLFSKETLESSDHIIFKSISLVLLLYMFYAALRFGTIMFYSYRKDFKDFKNRIENQRIEELKYKNAILKIEKYVDKVNKENQEKKNQEL